ncbi:MAG: protein jag [Firmicutes bacterium]|nr:protein jag [Bacillota bacterium]
MEFTGKTVEEAIALGLSETGLTEETAEITVLDEGGKGFLKKTKARVEVSKKRTNGERAVKFLEELLDRMEIVAKVSLVSEEEKIEINVVAESSASVIGYRGEVLDALQSLAGAVANMGNKTYVRVVVDCENYRGKREDTLVNLAEKLAAKAVRQGRDISLEPMGPYERRVIHSALAASEEVTTTSEGKEPNRYVVIVPNVKKEQRPRNFNRDYAPREGGYHREKRGGREGFNRGGERRNDRGGRNHYSRDRGSRSGFTSEAEAEKRKKPSGFGTYLGNSLKNDNE